MDLDISATRRARKMFYIFLKALFLIYVGESIVHVGEGEKGSKWGGSFSYIFFYVNITVSLSFQFIKYYSFSWYLFLLLFQIRKMLVRVQGIGACLLRHAAKWSQPNVSQNHRLFSSKPENLNILGEMYMIDKCTNVSPRVLNKIGKNLHCQKFHPLNLIQLRIKNYFYKNFLNRYGNPMFAVFDNMCPVVTLHQNFDSLLVPKDHISRSPSDSYYVNSSHLLRAHTSAHQEELIKMGFDTFLVAGDVYRRDEIDATHYPVFHQMEGVRLFSEHQVCMYCWKHVLIKFIKVKY